MEKIHVNSSEEGYRVLAEKLDIPGIDKNDNAARIAYVKNIIKKFVEL